MKTAVKKREKNMRITIPASLAKKGELVIVPRSEYEQMKASMVPTKYLKGMAASALDRRVQKAIKEHRAKKTAKIGSLSDLV